MHDHALKQGLVAKSARYIGTFSRMHVGCAAMPSRIRLVELQSLSQAELTLASFNPNGQRVRSWNMCEVLPDERAKSN